jgi:hypothetical protein
MRRTLFLIFALISITWLHAEMIEPDRVMRVGDLVQIKLKLPDRSFTTREPIQKTGEVPTPEGSFLPASGFSIGLFTTNLIQHYSKLRGYESAEVAVVIYSSPYKVVRYVESTSKPSNVTSTNSVKPPTLLPRSFKKPITLWEAIQEEGGFPQNINSRKVKVLKQDLSRKTYDCSGPKGEPDGKIQVESGDYIFLVPEDAPISQIFE